MKTSLDQLVKPLPASKKKELAKVQEIIVNRLQAEQHMFTLEMIILFGSYARGKWVEDGYVKDGITYEYKSDFDILVVTQQGISESNWIGLCIDENIDKHPAIKTEVNIIHHGIQFLNKKIEENYYFFVDIGQEGVLLYDTGRYKLSIPGAMTPAVQGQKAQEEFEYWVRKADEFWIDSQNATKRNSLEIAAFYLHQATESYYSAILLVFTDYRPRGHNLKRFSKQASGTDARFQAVFPVRNRREKELFQLLKRAYIDARYKKEYTITADELQYLSERVLLLRELTEQLCGEEIARLKGLV
ncbi:MAG: HEPN domain-containing protein [Bacteroidota bacterium]